MKKELLFILLMFFINVAQAAVDTLKLKSKVSDVTVNFSGAQVTRTAFLSATKGRHLILIRNISPEIDAKSIQVGIEAGCTMLSIKTSQDHSAEGKETDEEKHMNTEIQKLEDHILELKSEKSVLESEEKLLLDNSRFASEKGTEQLNALKQAAEFYRTRLSEIRKRYLQLSNDIDDSNDRIMDIQTQRSALTSADHLVYNKILISVECERDFADTIRFSYYLPSAGWTPTYDFRVEDISKPLSIVYNANVFQSTGENWENVKLTLATNNPQQTNKKPVLERWIAGTTDPNITMPVIPGVGELRGRVLEESTGDAIPFAAIFLMDGDRIISSTNSDMEGQFVFRPVASGYYQLKVSAIGFDAAIKSNIHINNGQSVYNDFKLIAQNALSEVVVTGSSQPAPGALIERASRGSVLYASTNIVDGQKVRTNFIMNGVRKSLSSMQYEIKIPYSIASDGADNLVKIKEVKMPVNYTFYVVPKLDADAFLVAELTDWTDLNLINGSASVYYAGTYIGQTDFDVNDMSDTLQVSLGRDKEISVQRICNTKLNGKRILGIGRKEKYDFTIFVKNKRDSKINLVVQDQYPVSYNKSILVELIESSSARVDEKAGLLTWNFTLNPNQKKDLNYKFEVRLPE